MIPATVRFGCITASRIRCAPFQYNTYDSDSALLFQNLRLLQPRHRSLSARRRAVDRRERPSSVQESRRESGSVSRVPARGRDCRRPASRTPARAGNLDPRVKKFDERMQQRAAAARIWLEQAGGEFAPFTSGAQRWLVRASAIVARWLDERPVHLGFDSDCAAFRSVFGGDNAAFADNLISVGNLVEHRPLSVQPSRVLYFDKVT
jgi:hypothetical protein